VERSPIHNFGYGLVCDMAKNTGVDGTWGHDIAANAEAAEFNRSHTRQRFETSFAGCVSRLARDASPGRNRAYKYNTPPALYHHRPAGSAHTCEGPAQIDREHLIPRVILQQNDWSLPCAAGNVHNAKWRSISLFYVLEKPSYASVVRDIERVS
jgi:hypothetical protein